MGLVVQGPINREVAARLFVAPHTVHTHLRHGFEKLKLNSRVELASVADSTAVRHYNHRTNM